MSKALNRAGELYAENAQLRQRLAIAEAEAAKWRTGADNMARLYERLKRSLSPQKQAVIDAALDNLDARAAAEVGVYREGEDIEC